MPLHTRIFIGLAVGVGVNWILGGEHPAVLWILSNGAVQDARAYLMDLSRSAMNPVGRRGSNARPSEQPVGYCPRDTRPLELVPRK
jgi:hypothetical protein